MVQIAAIRGGTRAEGPGLRVAVWTQGCSIKCLGCFNPELWGTRGGESLDAAELTNKILNEVAAHPGTEGITFMGGEPFDQPADLAQVTHSLRKAGLSVMVFTGFTLEELQAREDVETDAFLREIDLLVDGQFEQDLVDPSRPWLGSSNQRFHLLSDRYTQADLEAPDALELTIKTSGEIVINGWATSSDLEQILETLT